MTRLSFLSRMLVPFCAVAAMAQAPPPSASVKPNYIVINREYLKPGKSGEVHAKSESAFVKAMAAAKYPTYYLGMDSMSGPSRSLFITTYDSLAAWEKDNELTDKNATLSAALEKASVADGELLESYDVGVFRLRPELSLNLNQDPAANRYFEIIQYIVKPGHEGEFDEMAKLFKDSFAKAVPGAHWAVYESVYSSQSASLFLVMFLRKSLAEVDAEASLYPKVFESMGADGQKRMVQLQAAAIQSVTTNLFHFNPRESYPSERFINVDPEFWKVKPAPAAKPKAATKP